MRFLWIILCVITVPALANEKPFGLWLQEFKADAARQGISAGTLNEALAETLPIERIVELDRKQPEGTKTLHEYLELVISPKRITEGRRMLAQYDEILSKIEAEYGVDKEIIVALWGIETSYGENTGNFYVVDALATLAYDGRRSDYFRKELINALKIIDEGHITPLAMDGSWAGAMGQCQFMPSSFLRYAVDYDGDGRRDIWHTLPDIFASIAFYLKSEGWEHGKPLALPVSLPQGFNEALLNREITKPLTQWKRLGVTYNDGSALPDGEDAVSVVMVGNDLGKVPYIIYPNFSVVLRWNRSYYFATAVDMLSEEIR